ncbi:MAG: hypothetical protein QNJ13_06080 [Paracoccaceae bacterium]|nr:hypothetical protein [Paracoccaceae bacterium]
MHAAALRARASGFTGTAEAIEEILNRELVRQGGETDVEASDAAGAAEGNGTRP